MALVVSATTPTRNELQVQAENEFANELAVGVRADYPRDPRSTPRGSAMCPAGMDAPAVRVEPAENVGPGS